MKNLYLSSCYAVAAAALVGLAACAGESTSPSEFASPTSARFALGDVSTIAGGGATPVVGKVKVCKSASSNVAGEFTITRTALGASAGTALATATVQPGECVVVAEDLSGSGIASRITVNETSAGFVSATAEQTFVGAVPYTNNSTVLEINSFHGFTVTYVNHVEEDEGCTLTQGYWKNHAEEWADLANDPFFSSGKTYLQILQTPVKGSAYIQLAHQYIAAYLNIQAGASTTPAVDAAMATALTYFTSGTGDISGLVTILDEYNNGVTGPGHCDDQEVILE
jgi:hypothetical protein